MQARALLSAVVARMERSEIRGGLQAETSRISLRSSGLL